MIAYEAQDITVPRCEVPLDFTLLQEIHMQSQLDPRLLQKMSLTSN